jgi:hypothetical protein
MAEAFAATSLNVNRQKLSIDFYTQPAAFSTIYESGIRSWKTRLRRRYNRLVQISYPNKLPHLGIYAGTVYACEKFLPNHAATQWMHNHQTWISSAIAKCVDWIQLLMPKKILTPIQALLERLFIDQSVFRRSAFVLISWFGWSFLLRQFYKWLLSYENFIFENPRTGYSLRTKVWFIMLRLFRGDPMMLSAQSALPSLPIPKVKETCARWLDSVRPLMNDAEFAECKELAKEFESGIGPKLQRYLHLKRTLSTNWCSDWWEEYVYLTSRSPIMVNSNFYIIAQAQIDGYDETELPTTNQAARAANCVHALFEWRYKLDRENLEPQSSAGIRPICMNQYERLFNTTRVPFKSRDFITHYDKGVNHIVVLHKNRYFKVMCYDAAGRPLSPAELEDQFQLILSDSSPVQPGEEKVAAFTAGSRDKWYEARKDHFYDSVNAAFLREVETSAFVLALDDEAYDNRLLTQEEGSELSLLAKSLIHGNCANRWFDKSFTLVVYKNCVIGLNGEHAWADAPVLGMTTEWILWRDHRLGYDAAGHARGIRVQSASDVAPIRLRLQLTRKAIKAVNESLEEAKKIADNVDLYVYPFTAFGKNRITKKWKCSPDAFIQLSLQLAHVLDKGKHVLTYESAMTRLWRDGRTETVRSATNLAKEFVDMLQDDSIPRKDVLKKFRQAAQNHVNMNLYAMVGRGVDRHLFGLYVVCSYIGLQSSFLKKAFSMPWGLSTSQTPTNQLSYITCKDKEYSIICPGGGFGPVDPNGYGVSYTIMGDSLLNFHVSSCHDAETTNSKRFARNIEKAMIVIGEFLDEVLEVK